MVFLLKNDKFSLQINNLNVHVHLMYYGYIFLDIS